MREQMTEAARMYADPDVPVPVKGFNRMMRTRARRVWPLEPEAIKAAARRKARLDDFGAAVSLDEPLGVLCHSMNTQLDLAPVGRLALQDRLVMDLVIRLRLEELADRHPEAFERPVERPVFIVGMPRSGTTVLHRMISRDPQVRATPWWELQEPLPAYGEPDAGAARRRRAGARLLRFARWISPEFDLRHENDNDDADEDVFLLAPWHASAIYEYRAPGPDYIEWYSSADHTPGFREYRRLIQAMNHVRPGGERWVAKAPSHCEMLKPLLTVFPDATIVQTHRDPVGSVVSFASLIATAARGAYARPDPYAIGQRVADNIERSLRAVVRDRGPDDARFVDVYLRDFVDDQLEQVRRVYKTAGMDLTDEAEAAMLAYLEGEQPKLGRHKPAAADFGLDEGELRERFAFYYERFDVLRQG